MKQGTSLTPIPNNYSLDEVCAHSNSYQYGTVEIKALEFVNDIDDTNSGSPQAFRSQNYNKHYGKNGRNSDVNLLAVYYYPMKVEETFKYLGDNCNSKGDNVAYYALNKILNSDWLNTNLTLVDVWLEGSNVR